MKNDPYRGDFTLSIPAMGGERFLTVMADHQVLLQCRQTEKTTFRLYCNGIHAVFVTPPMGALQQDNAQSGPVWKKMDVARFDGGDTPERSPRFNDFESQLLDPSRHRLYGLQSDWRGF